MNIFNAVWMTWFASEILIFLLIRSDKTDKKKQDKSSLLFLWIMVSLAISSGIIISNYIKIPISNIKSIYYIGLVIIVCGIILRLFSIVTLGRLFTVDVTIRENHTLKKDGIYKIVRHPSYIGSLLSFIGFGIMLNNWLSLLSIFILMTIGFLYRIKIEEKALIEQFGADYLDYKKNTRCMIPWIY